MSQPGVSVPRAEVLRRERRVETPLELVDDDRLPFTGGGGIPGRRTVTIQGRGSERYRPAPGNGTRPSSAAPRPSVRPYEKAGFRPDKVAMWAVLLGVLLVVVAATSSHAAVLALHAVPFAGR
jgi:hypothetical protein